MYHKWYTSFVATKYLSMRELRPRLPSVVRDAAATSARYVVTRRGKPEAVILSLEDYESLIETLEVEKNVALVRRLRRAKLELKKGKRGKPLEEIHKALSLSHAAAGRKGFQQVLREGYLEMAGEAQDLARDFEALDRESLKHAD